MKYKEQILKLRKVGKSYREIASILGCSRGTISYHCGVGQKEKAKKRVKKFREKNVLSVKIDSFKNKRNLRSKCKDFQTRTLKPQLNGKRFVSTKELELKFDTNSVIKKFGDKPICYLTGRPLDYHDTSSLNFDHIVPVARGGDNSLENLGLCCPQANKAKSDMLVDEFLQLCKEVIEHNGGTVIGI